MTVSALIADCAPPEKLGASYEINPITIKGASGSFLASETENIIANGLFILKDRRKNGAVFS